MRPLRRSWKVWPTHAEDVSACFSCKGEKTSLRIIQTVAIDGLIVFSMPKDDVTLRTVTDRALPMVIVDGPKLPGIPFVGIDEGAAARACAQHLKDLDTKTFGIVTFKFGAAGHCGFIDRKRVKNSCYGLNRSQVQGYLEVLDNSGSVVSVKLWEWPRSNEEGGRTAAESLFSEHPRPTAILAASDRLGIGVIEAARRRRLRCSTRPCRRRLRWNSSSQVYYATFNHDISTLGGKRTPGRSGFTEGEGADAD